MMNTTTSDLDAQPTSAMDQPVKVETREKSPAGAPSAAGLLWIGGWLFTIGFARLVWWQDILGLVLWPYFLGSTITIR
jgi:hypothetical protein